MSIVLITSYHFALAQAEVDVNVAVIVETTSPRSPVNVQWTGDALYFKAGAGVDPTNATNKAQAFAIALKTARVLAYERLAEYLTGIAVKGQTKLEHEVLKDSVLTTKVDALVQGATVVTEEPKELSDGSIWVEVTLKIGNDKLESSGIAQPKDSTIIPATGGSLDSPQASQSAPDQIATTTLPPDKPNSEMQPVDRPDSASAPVTNAVAAGESGPESQQANSVDAPPVATSDSPHSPITDSPRESSPESASVTSPVTSAPPSTEEQLPPQDSAAEKVPKQLPPNSAEPPVDQAPTGQITGLVINTVGLNVLPSIALQVFAEDGRKIYGLGILGQQCAEPNGFASFIRNSGDATKFVRSGEHPLIVKAMQKLDKSRAGLLISNDDADRIKQAEEQTQILSRCAVVVVTD